MRKIVKKVDGVKSVNEALELQELGADLISVSVNYDLAFGDKVVVDKYTIIAIRSELHTTKLVGSIFMNFDEGAMLKLTDEIGFDYIQILGHIMPSIQFRKELEKRGIGIIYSRIDASYDDDNNWILATYDEESDLNASYYNVSYLGDVTNSWNFMKNVSPQYSDQLQIDDITKLASNFPLLITFDFSVDNIGEIVDRIPTIKGISMMIAEESGRNNDHYLSYDSVVAILKKINEVSLPEQ